MTKNVFSLMPLCLYFPRTLHSKQHRGHHCCRDCWSSHVVQRRPGPVPVQTVSINPPPPSATLSCLCLSVCPVNQSDCTLPLVPLHQFPLSFSRLSFRGGLRAASAFTLSSPLSVRLPFANFLFLFIWICVPGTHWGEEFAMNAPCHR